PPNPIDGPRALRRWGLALAVLAASACPKEPPPPAPPIIEEEGPTIPPLQQATDEIFEAWFAARPVTATALGEHRRDVQWPTLTAEGIEADRQRIEAGVQRLSALDPTGLAPAERVDLEILRNGLERQRFEHEVEQPWLR